MRRTWGPFLGRFGRVTEIQGHAIPPLLEGHSAVLCAPTASGKTEAAVAPLVERHLPVGTDVCRLLIVVPTRALVNDLFRRLDGPFSDLRLILGARHGERRAAKGAAAIITTPESLDSMLCRERDRLEHVSAIILDELHLLDGTYRGDQLRILLRRLPSVQTVALSATVPDATAMAQRYISAPTTIVEVGEPRPIDLTLVGEAEEAVRLLRQRRHHKALWFCNTRAEVERLSQELRAYWPENRLLAHHGSLSKRERESAERAMQEWRWGICVATMTLELGVDIGDVDCAVLQGPPPSAAAYQQRLGRACRRTDRIAAIGVTMDPDDTETFELLRDMSEAGELEEVDATPDPSVVVQQLMSLLYAAPAGVQRDELESVLTPLTNRAELALTLDHMVEERWIETGRGGLIRATTRLMDEGEKGRVHSNIPTPKEHQFRDAATGLVLGAALTSVQAGDTMVFAGRSHRVVSVGRADVQLVPHDGPATTPGFRAAPSRGAFTHFSRQR